MLRFLFWRRKRDVNPTLTYLIITALVLYLYEKTYLATFKTWFHKKFDRWCFQAKTHPIVHKSYKKQNKKSVIT